MNIPNGSFGGVSCTEKATFNEGMTVLEIVQKAFFMWEVAKEVWSLCVDVKNLVMVVRSKESKVESSSTFACIFIIRGVSLCIHIQKFL